MRISVRQSAARARWARSAVRTGSGTVVSGSSGSETRSMDVTPAPFRPGPGAFVLPEPRPRSARSPVVAGSTIVTSTARNCLGVSSSTAFVGSPTSSARFPPERGQRSEPAVGQHLVDQPAVAAGEERGHRSPACGSSTRTAVSTACSTTASVWCPRRRAKRCCDQPPAAVRPCTCRASTFETTSSAPSNTPTAHRPRRTSSTAARWGSRAAVVSEVSRAGARRPVEGRPQRDRRRVRAGDVHDRRRPGRRRRTHRAARRRRPATGRAARARRPGGVHRRRRDGDGSPRQHASGARGSSERSTGPATSGDETQ